MADNQAELFKLHRAGQDKYAYFLLAAAGAAIAFALSQTKGAALAIPQIPLGLAVALWGASFYSGCQHLHYVDSSLFTNADLIRVESGAHPLTGRHPQAMQIGSETLRQIIDDQGRESQRWARAQFRLLISGALFYMGWHVLEMYLRTSA
ncbi:hypothetical protein [Phenylobacterium sp.]|uniref:hypothetical protein n=1 Tax=Phenylobacterium sp. TaxID=1871053 RepID=UPI002FC6963F